MSILKSALQGFLLLTISMSMVFVSCTKQEIIVADSIESNEFDIQKRYFVLPYGYETKTKEEVAAYVSNLSQENFEELERSYIVKSYLKTIDKIELVTRDLVSGDLYSEVNLENYLSERELSLMSQYHPEEEASRCDVRISCNYSTWWCNSVRPYFHVRRKCNGQYYGFCANNCNVW